MIRIHLFQIQIFKIQRHLMGCLLWGWAGWTMVQALAAYPQEISVDPAVRVRAVFAQAQWKLDNQDWRGAITDLSGLIEATDPPSTDLAGADTNSVPLGDQVRARLHRGMAQARLGNIEEARQDWNWVIELEGEDGLVAAAKGLALHNQGILLLEQGEPEQAKQILDQAIAADAQRASSFIHRGLAQAELGAFGEVLNDANTALDLDPELATAHQLRGIARYHLGDIEGSLTDFDRALELDPDLGSAYQNRGIAYRDLNQTEAAIADLIEARERLVSQNYDRYQRVIRQLTPLQQQSEGQDPSS